MEKGSDGMEKINMYEELFISRFNANSVIFADLKYAEQVTKEELDEAVTLDDKVAALNDIIAVYLYDDRHEEALKLVEDYIDEERTISFKVQLLLFQGRISENVLDYNGAIKYYQKALGYGRQDGIDYYFVYNNLGFCYNFSKDFNKAEKACSIAIEINPGRYNALKNLGVSMECRGKYKDALKCFMKAAELSNKETRTMMHLHRLLRRRPEIRKNLVALIAEFEEDARQDK